MDFDGILLEVGGFGKYQKLVFWLILMPITLPCGFNAYNQLFMSIVPDHWCKVPELEGLDVMTAKNLSIPMHFKDGSYQFEKCFMYKKNYTSMSNVTDSAFENENQQIIPCKNGWSYDNSHNLRTIISDWNLVCDHSFMPTLALALFGFGGFIGTYFFGYLQDGLGRKLSFYIYLGVQCAFGIATAFTTGFITWTGMRILTGLTIPAMLGAPIVLSIELVSPRYRAFVTLAVNAGYAVTLMLLALVAWAIRDWRTLALATTLPFLLIFFQWKLVPESPRWLLAKGNFLELEKLLNKMAKINGKQLPPNYITQLKSKMEETQEKNLDEDTYGILSLFKYPNLRWKTAIITFIWFNNMSVYVGLSYYATSLAGDEYLNFFLTGAVEMPAYLFLWPALEKWGRRWNLCVTMVFGGAACVATCFFQNEGTITLILYCIGKMGVSCSFVLVPLVASEIYPTVVRGLGMSFSGLIGMIGPIFIPLVNYLGSNMLTLPLIIMGLMCIMGGVASLLLPETLNQHLPQNLLDAEKAGLCFVTCHKPTGNRTNDSTDHEIPTRANNSL